VPFSFGDETTNAGDLASVTCSVVKGDTPITINWFFNGTEIKSNDEITISKVGKKISMLSIESVRAEYVGEYTCVAKNAAGATNISTYLYINGLNLILYFCFTGVFCFCIVLLFLWFDRITLLTLKEVSLAFFSFASNSSVFRWRRSNKCRRFSFSDMQYYQRGFAYLHLLAL